MSLGTICMRTLRTACRASSSMQSPTVRTAPRLQRKYLPYTAIQTQRRTFAEKSQADLVIDDITELYATAQDEFEIAMEETEKMSVYAEEDRKAAQEELQNVQAAYKKVVEGEDKDLAEQVSKRIGQRIRELEAGVKRMEEMAMEQD